MARTGRKVSAAERYGRARLGAAGRIPTEGRSSVSTEQRENLEAILGQLPFPAGSDVSEQRGRLQELGIGAAAVPLLIQRVEGERSW